MATIRAQRMLNAIELGTTSGSQLETLLTSDPSRAAALNVLCGMRGQVRRMISSQTTMSAILSSPTALGIMAGNPTSLALMSADPGLTDTLVSSPIAKMAIFNSDAALNFLASSPTLLDAFRASSQYAVRSGNATTATAIVGPVAAGSYIVLGVSTSNAASTQVLTLSTVRPGSRILATTTSDGTNFGATALYYPKAIPLVTPFRMSQPGSAYTWYFGMLRCDV